MRRVLTRLEVEWKAQGAPVLDHLAPGISDEEIDAVLPAGVVLGEDARELFRWHNGDLGDDLSDRFKSDFGFGWRFAPLAELVDDYNGAWRNSRELVAGANGLPVSWWPGWFPIFLGSGWLRLLARSGPGIPAVAVAVGTDPEDEHSLLVRRHYSVLTMVETWSAFLGTRLIRWDPQDNAWQVDAHWDSYNAALRGW